MYFNGEKEDSGVWESQERIRFRNGKPWKKKKEKFMKFPSFISDGSFKNEKRMDYLFK